MLTTLAEVAGFVAVVVGVGLVAVPSALIVGGVGLVAAGVLLGRDG